MLRTSRRTILSVMLAAMIAVLPTTAAVAQAQGAAQRPAAPLSVPVTGTAGDSTVAGTFNIQRFANRNGALVAIGNFVGTVTNPTTGPQTVVAPLALPVNTQATTATCEILNLVLGPLDLNLLGLQIHLNQVVLNITAVPGAGNLLGNLLCSIAGLLDGGALSGLATLLNNLLAALGSL
jgi:hypothetical protein